MIYESRGDDGVILHVVVDDPAAAAAAAKLRRKPYGSGKYPS